LRRGRRKLEGHWVRSTYDRNIYEANLPELESDSALVSIEFELPARTQSAEIEIDGRRFLPTPYKLGASSTLFTSPRFHHIVEAVLHLQGSNRPKQIPLVVKLWRKGRH
ncbi:MAG: hypothetical protein P8Y44_08815, partial [Acidobacteriota bacterium]